MKPQLTPTARDLLRALRGAPGGVAEHRFFSVASTAREADAVARTLLDLEERGLIRKRGKREDPGPGARETVWVLARKGPAMSPAPWAVSSEKGAFYIHPDGSPGVLAKVYRRADARLIRAAPDLLAALRSLVEAHDEKMLTAEEWERARAALRGVARGQP